MPARIRTQGRGELREQPATGRWSGDDSNCPYGAVTTASTIVAERAVPRAPGWLPRQARSAPGDGGLPRQARAAKRPWVGAPFPEGSPAPGDGGTRAGALG